MDGVHIVSVVIAINVPTWLALWRLHYKMGQLDQKMLDLNGSNPFKMSD